MEPRMVVFHAAKRGHAEHEWEDAAAGRPADPWTGRPARYAVTDGATEGIGSARWARYLAEGFVGLDPRPDTGTPALARAPLRDWLHRTQQRWADDSATAGATDLQRLKIARVGSFATLVGCELTGLDGPRPRWHAVAVGDALLFQVRGRRLVAHFPPMAAGDFGVNPDGIPTKPERLAVALDSIVAESGDLAPDDRLYLATDAFARWILETREDESLWDVLAHLDHPSVFARLVADHRASGAMVDDDVTLLRVHLATTGPAYLVVCL